jgi:hypothetical protein
VDIFGNEQPNSHAPRVKKIKTPEWLLKGGEPPRRHKYIITYDEQTDEYHKIGRKRLARLKKSSRKQLETCND